MGSKLKGPKAPEKIQLDSTQWGAEIYYRRSGETTSITVSQRVWIHVHQESQQFFSWTSFLNVFLILEVIKSIVIAAT